MTGDAIGRGAEHCCQSVFSAQVVVQVVDAAMSAEDRTVSFSMVTVGVAPVPAACRK